MGEVDEQDARDEKRVPEYRPVAHEHRFEAVPGGYEAMVWCPGCWEFELVR